MYEIIKQEVGRIGMLSNSYYSEKLGLTPEYICKVLSGKLNTKMAVAKGIISLAYGIPLTNYEVDELLEKHFTKVK